MTNWQRRTRLGFGFFAIIFGIIVLMAIRERSQSVDSVLITRTDPDVIMESTSTEVTQTQGAQQDLIIEAKRQLAYQNGDVRLVDGVTVRVPMRAGRNEFVMTGQEAEISAGDRSVKIIGDVRLVVSDGITAQAPAMSIGLDRSGNANTEIVDREDRGRMISMSGQTIIKGKDLTASSLGATYDGALNILALLDEAKVTLGNSENENNLDITAGNAVLAQGQGYMRFEEGVVIEGSDQTIVADAATAHIGKELMQMEMIELFGSSRVVRRDHEMGQLREMSADNVTLSYSATTNVLERATLTESATIELVGELGQVGPRISAMSIDVIFGSDGVNLDSVIARNAVQVDFPENGAMPAQSVRALGLDGIGEPGLGLTEAKFIGPIEYYETRSENSQVLVKERITRARELIVSFNAGLAGINEALFIGDVRLQDGQLNAESGSARYNVGQGRVELLSREDETQIPRVFDRDGSVVANRIELELEHHGLIADGEVRSVLETETAQSSSGELLVDDELVRMPRILDENRAVYLMGALLEHGGENSLAVYTGGSKLWQGETEIQADTIILDESQGNLNAEGSVFARSFFGHLNEETNEVELTRTLGWGGELAYDDEAGRMAYTTEARVSGPAGDLRGNRVELYLTENRRAIERIEAYEDVSFRTADRMASGERLTYFSDDGRYEMSGTPVRLIEQLELQCRETIGRSLTFFRLIDTITVDGNNEIRTESIQTITGACPDL